MYTARVWEAIVVCFVTLILELIRPGKDQRDYYYFMALGHYKLEVSSWLKNHKIYPIHVNVSTLCMHRFQIFIIVYTILWRSMRLLRVVWIECFRWSPITARPSSWSSWSQRKSQEVCNLHVHIHVHVRTWSYYGWTLILLYPTLHIENILIIGN